MYDIFSVEVGLNKWMSKDPINLTFPVDSVVSSSLGNPISGSVSLGLLADGENTSLMSVAKLSFTDTTEGKMEGLDTDNKYKWIIGGATNSIDWNVTTANTLTVIGTISGSVIIGGELHIPDIDTTANSFHVATDADTWWGCTETNFTADNDNATAYVLKTGIAQFQSVTLTGNVIATDFQPGTDIAIQGWSSTIAFVASDFNTVTWSAGGTGTIKILDGTTYTIVAGTTDNMGAKTYIYLDINVSTTVLQKTTTGGTAVGKGKILVCVADVNADTGSKAQFQTFGGYGGVNLFVDNLAANSASVNEFVSNTAQIKDLIVTNAKITSLVVDKLTSGSITSQTVVLALVEAAGDVYIAGGTYTPATWTCAGGFMLGIDDSDSNKNKFYIGDATNHLDWNVTTLNTLTIKGAITADTGYIGGTTGWVITSNYIKDVAGVTGLSSVVTGGDDIRIWAGHATPASAPFYVTEAGALVATSATITGVITANTGYIGGTTGWVITSNYIKDVAGVTGMSSVVTVGDDIRFWAGHATPASAPFYVTEAGALVATSATITGSVTATTGSIGGWVIGATSLMDAAGTVGMSSAVTGGDDIRFWAGDVTPASSEFYVTEAGVIKASSGTIGGCVLAATSIGSTTFVSGPLGKGWNISNTGTAEFQNATVRGMIRTSVFEKDTISCVNGIVLVSSADVLSADMTALDASTVTISGQTTFAANEVIRIKDGTDDEWMLVTSAVGAPTYVVTRDLASSYPANTNPIWKTGTAVVSMGVGTGTKTGFVLLDSSSSYSPYIDIYGRNSNTYTDYTLHGRFGWLKGITDADVGLATTDVWGLYTDNAYIKGVVVANTGYIGGTTGWVISSNYIKDVAGVCGMSSVVTAGDDIRFWAGHATPASAPFYVTEAGALTATSATITGVITANTGYIGGSGGWTIAAGTISSVNGGNTTTLASGGTNAFIAGPTGSPTVSISHAGVLTASGAVISGTISVGSMAKLPPDSSLIGYWSFDESSGGVIYDYSVNGLNGTATDVTFGTGISGTCGVFNNTSSDVVITHNALLHSASFSWSVWIKPIDVSGVTDNIISKDGAYLMQRSDDDIELYVWDGGDWEPSIDMTSVLTAGTWTHIVFTYSAGVMKGYIDGAYKTQTSNTISYTGSANLHIGNWATGGGVYFNGSIDEPRMYNYALTANEVKALYLYPNGIQSQGVASNKGVLSGWTISAAEISSGSVKIQSTAERILMGSATAPMTGVGVFLGLDTADYEFRVGNPAGNYFHYDGSALTLNGATVSASVLSGIAAGTDISILGWQNTCVFSATDYNTVAWGAGTITLMTGTTYAISAGNTDNIAALTYIYFSTASSTVFLTTTDAAIAVGANKILVAVASPNTDTTSDATFQVFGGTGGVLLAVDSIAANSASTNEFVSNTAQIKDLIVTNAKINDLAVSKLTAGSITSKEIVLAMSEGTGDCFIAGGTYTAASWTCANGFMLGLDDSDSNKEKFYIGTASSWMDWNVTTADTLTIAGTLSVGSIPKLPNDDALLHYWSFDEGSGSTVNDYGSENNAGTITEATFTNGQVGKCLNFDGTDDYIEIDDDHITTTSFNANAWAPDAVGIMWKSDGTKAYILDAGTDDVFQFSAGTAWAVNSLSYDTVTMSTTAEDSGPQGWAWAPDGSKFYVVGNTNKKIFQYNLGTPWDLSTAAYATKFYATAEDTAPRGVCFNATGSKMYYTGDTGNAIFQCTLSTPWDVSTATYDTVTISSPSTAPRSLMFNSDGTVLFVSDDNNVIYRMALSGAYNLATATWVAGDQYMPTDSTSPYGLYVKSDGLQLYSADLDGYIYQYTLSVADNFYNPDYINGFTVSAWIKADTVGETNGIIINKSAAAYSWYGFNFYVGTSGTSYVAVQVAGGTARASAVGSIVFGDGNWYHVVATVAADSTCTLYVNGVQSGTPGTSGALNKIVARKMRIGNYCVSTTRTFDGLIDEPRIYNRVLTVSEVKALYTNPSAIQQQGIASDRGLLAGWTINSGYIYSLASGTPTSTPTDGVVLASTNQGLTIYEDAAKRVELGYLSAGVYGLKGYATDGTTTLFELSDAGNTIAGWTINATTIANGTNIILDAANKKISINDATFGNDGVQIEYNAGNPRMYIGNGSTKYLNFNGTDVTVGGDSVVVTTGASFVEDGSRKIYQIFDDLTILQGATALSGYIYVLEDGVRLLIKRYLVTNDGHMTNKSGIDESLYWINSATYDSTSSITAIGSYLYCTARKAADATNYLLRITPADGTITEMTISGTAPASWGRPITSDGTFLYVSKAASDVDIYKYSISGTTATYVSTITMPDQITYLGCDNTYLYLMTKSGAGPTLETTCYKTTLAGVEQARNVFRYDGSVVSIFMQGVSRQGVGKIVETSGAGSLYGIFPYVLN